jgi:hypothetical protein
MTASFDGHKNLAYSAVATAPSPATSGTSLVLTTGGGALFPAAPFNAVIWPGGGATASQANAEIVRVTAISTDTLTIIRAQEGTTAQSIGVGYQAALTATAKVFTDLETAVNATLGGVLTGTLPSPGLAGGAVGTAQLALGACTQNGFGSASATQSTTSATYVDLDAVNAAVTLTTTGGDLFCWFAGDVSANTAVNDAVRVALALDGGTEVGQVDHTQTGAFGFAGAIGLVWRFTGVASGAHTVKVRWHGSTGGNSYSATNRGLLVMETKR